MRVSVHNANTDKLFVLYILFMRQYETHVHLLLGYTHTAGIPLSVLASFSFSNTTHPPHCDPASRHLATFIFHLSTSCATMPPLPTIRASPIPQEQPSLSPHLKFCYTSCTSASFFSVAWPALPPCPIFLLLNAIAKFLTESRPCTLNYLYPRAHWRAVSSQ